MYKMSVHQLPQYYQQQQVPSIARHMIYMLQTSAYQNITKLFTHPKNLSKLKTFEN